jgi:hypothetical protein
MMNLMLADYPRLAVKVLMVVLGLLGLLGLHSILAL